MTITTINAGETATAAQMNSLKNHLEGEASSSLAWFFRVLASNNMVIKLPDNAGAQKIVVQDSDGVEVASIDSDGLFTPTGLQLPTGSAPTPTVDGQIWWDTDDDILVVGTGSTQKQIGASTSLKTSSGGYFVVPAGPAVGINATSSGTIHTYGAWVEAIASTAAALYIVGVTIDHSATSDYVQVDIGTGAAASETSISEWKTEQSTVDGTTSFTFPFPIPVATATRIAVRVADGVASTVAYPISLICINQADLVAI